MCGSRSRNGRASQAGFTLVEIVVAFAVLALALGALLPAFSGGLRSIDVAEDDMRAVLLGRSTIDLVGREIPLQEGEYSGSSEDGFEWLVRITPLPAPRDSRDDFTSELASFDVQVEILRDGGQRLTLETLRIAPME